jgi:hypothetical protein
MERQYFAQLDDNNLVTHVAVVQREFLEANPQRYTGRWVETFIDDSHIYAGLGFEYLESEEDFRPPKPYSSWIWANKNWNAPTPMPLTGGPYRWSEEDLEWVAI